jgi:hypothetical protein
MNAALHGAAALLLSALFAGPCGAAEKSDDKTAPATEKREEPRDEPRPESRDKAVRTGDDLESCKRDADGMKGPERSRFMTECLRERK